MEEIKTIKELQQIELNILKYVDKLCRENGLTYFLAYGTLLGAVRHQGFIPWDDDIDILMPRDDYEILCNILHEKNGRYKILCSQYDKNYMYAFGKVIDSNTQLVEQEVTVPNLMGVYIDVFPYDGLRGNPEDNRIFLKACSLLEKCRYLSTFPYEAIKHVIWWRNIWRVPFWILLKAINYRTLVKVLNYLIKKYAVKNSHWVGCLCAQAIYKELVPEEVVAAGMTLKFEGTEFMVPIGYDTMLTKMYGDYMTLPPIEEREPHHDFKAWWIEEEETL